MQIIVTQKNQKLGDLTMYKPVEIFSCPAELPTASPFWIQKTISEVHPENR